MTQAPVNSVDTLAAIIREVDRGHGLSAHALARAILDHPGSRWGAAAPSINFRHLLSPEPGFERVPDDGDPERLPRDAQHVGGTWWVPRFGSNSLAATFGAILERMAEGHTAASQTELPADGEVAELMKWLKKQAAKGREYGLVDWIDKCTSILKLLQQCQQDQAKAAPTIPAPVSLLAAPWPELPSEGLPKVEKTFYEYEVFNKEYITIAGGTTPTYEQSLSKVQGYLACHRQAELDLEVRRIQVLNTDALQCQQEQAKAAPLPIAPQAELPEDPPNAKGDGSLWEQGFKDGWEAARAELQRQQEGQGLPAPEPPAAPIFPHANISFFRFDDDLIEMLIRGVMRAVHESMNLLLIGTLQSPVSEVKARLDEVLELAGYRAGDKISS